MNYIKTILLYLTAVSAFADTQMRWQAGTGYRQDSLNWNIASPTGTPNVLSELSWKNLRMITFDTELVLILPCPPYTRLNASYGTIYHGTVRDSDWHGNDRTDEYSRSISKANQGEAFNLSAAFGWTCYNLFDCIRIVPVAGVALEEQHLQMINGKQTINTVNGDVGPIHGLHSNYRARWYSPFVGFDAEIEAPQCFSLYGTIEWHYNLFRGSGHWNLRDEFINDFKHRATGWGTLYKVGCNYNLLSYMAVGLYMQIQDYHTRKGWDKIDLIVDQINEAEEIIGTRPITVRQPLNAVNWHSAKIVATFDLYW